MVMVMAELIEDERLKFRSLPDSAKHAILHQLSLRNLKTCRLVCKEWFHFINSVPKFQRQFCLKLSDETWKWAEELLHSFNEDSRYRHQPQQLDNDDDDNGTDTLPTMILSTPCINHLLVSKLTKSIIYSATRRMIPKSKIVSLYGEITRDNLVHLFQYQVPGARQLYLNDFCLVNLGSDCRFLDPYRYWLNLVALKFEFWYEIHKTTFLDFTRHVLALDKLLSIIELPKLRYLSASIDFPKQEESCHGRAKLQFMEHISKKFNQQFATFLTQWGNQLSRFYVYLHGINMQPILQSFVHLSNVRRFKFCLNENDSGLQASDIANAFQPLKNLVTMRVSLPPEFEHAVSSVLWQNNRSTLLVSQFRYWMTSLHWIHPPVQNKLEYMELRWKIQDNNFFQSDSADADANAVPRYSEGGHAHGIPAYYNMTRLKLFLHLNPYFDTSSLNPSIGQQLVNWIVQTMPNLTHLQLFSTNTLITDLINFTQLICSLEYLEQIDIHDRWKSLHKKIPLREIEKLCENTKGIRGTWMDDYTFYRITFFDEM